MYNNPNFQQTSYGFAPSTAKPSWSAYAASGPLSAATREHLQRVYTTLLCMSVLAATGVLLEIRFALAIQPFILGLATIGLVIWFLAVPADASTTGQRAGILALFGLATGYSLAPLIRLALAIDPTILQSAIVSTVAVFATMSALALCAVNRRSYLYLGGLLFSALNYLLIASLANIFFRSSLLMDAQLYIGLGVFSLFVLFDTQKVIFLHENGDSDYLKHALDLYLDLLNIFRKILVILIKNSGKRREEK